MKRQDRHKAKAGKQESPSSPHKDCAQENECKWNGDARVSGEIGVKIPPDFLAQYQADQKDNTTHNNKSRLINWLTFFAVVIYAGLTAWLGFMTRTLVKTAQDTYAAANRPYIGISEIQVHLFYPAEKAGAPKVGSTPQDANTVSFRVQIKNFGTVPGTLSQDIGLEERINGNKMPSTRLHGSTSELFPGESMFISGNAGPTWYPSIARGDAILQVNVSAGYAHGGKEYSYCERIQYSPENEFFYNLGAICNEPWETGKK